MNKLRHYHPDFSIELKDGRKVVYEIKSEWTVKQREFSIKTEVARAYFQKENIEYVVLILKESRPGRRDFTWIKVDDHATATVA